MSERSRLRLVVVQVLVFSLLLTLTGRLWYLQVLASGD
jgi:penicillin-binding protein 2